MAPFQASPQTVDLLTRLWDIFLTSDQYGRDRSIVSDTCCGLHPLSFVPNVSDASTRRLNRPVMLEKPGCHTMLKKTVSRISPYTLFQFFTWLLSVKECDPWVVNWNKTFCAGVLYHSKTNLRKMAKRKHVFLEILSSNIYWFILDHIDGSFCKEDREMIIKLNIHCS